MNNDKKFDSFLLKIKEVLAEHQGVEVNEINDDDSLMSDLHMTPTDVVDFIHNIETTLGVDTAHIDLASIDTVSELAEAVSSKEYME